MVGIFSCSSAQLSMLGSNKQKEKLLWQYNLTLVPIEIDT